MKSVFKIYISVTYLFRILRSKKATRLPNKRLIISSRCRSFRQVYE